MSIFCTKYRVVRYHNVFEVQFRYWWMPFYLQCEANTWSSLDRANEYIEALKTVYVDNCNKEKKE